MEKRKEENLTLLSAEELYDIEGGSFWGAIAAGLLKVGTAVGAACGVGATGGFIIIGASVVAIGVAIYAGCNS